MRLQHAKQVAQALPAEDPDQQQAKAEIVSEVGRLRWRVWHGKAKAARLTLKRLRTLLPTLEREPARKLRGALRAVDRYLRSQSAWLVNYAERHRAGLRIGTSRTEGTANFLVNKRLAKSQQMRWTRRGADLLLQVRCRLQRSARIRLRPAVRASIQLRPSLGRGGVVPTTSGQSLCCRSFGDVLPFGRTASISGSHTAHSASVKPQAPTCSVTLPR